MENNEVLNMKTQLLYIQSYCKDKLEEGVRSLFEKEALERLLIKTEHQLAQS